MRDLIPLSQFLHEVGTQLNMDIASPAIIHYTLLENNNVSLELDTSHSKNPRTRHVAVKYSFFRELFSEVNRVVIQRVESKYQKAGVFTKVLPAEKLHYIRNLLAGW